MRRKNHIPPPANRILEMQRRQNIAERTSKTFRRLVTEFLEFYNGQSKEDPELKAKIEELNGQWLAFCRKIEKDIKMEIAEKEFVSVIYKHIDQIEAAVAAHRGAPSDSPGLKIS